MTIREVTIPVTFKIGTLQEIGLGGLKVAWIDATLPDKPGREYGLTAGAGVGNPLMEADVHEGKRHAYARADVSDVARQIWAELDSELEATGGER